MKIPVEQISLLKQEDNEARQQFWKQQFQSVLSICSRILGAGPSAVDVTVDLLNDFLFHYVHRLSNEEGAWAYLKLMAVRRSVRERKRLAKKESFDECMIPGGAMALSGIAQDEIAKQELVGYLLLLNECLEGLSPKAQSTIRLKFKKGLSNQDIGLLVGGSKQYIGKLIQKSLVLLKKCIHQKEVSHV